MDVHAVSDRSSVCGIATVGFLSKRFAPGASADANPGDAVSCLLCTVTFHANHAHNLTRSPYHI